MYGEGDRKLTLVRLVDKKTPAYNPEEKVYVKGKYHKKKDIVSALTLQESLKKYLETQTHNLHYVYKDKDWEYYNMFLGRLQSMIKESKT